MGLFWCIPRCPFGLIKNTISTLSWCVSDDKVWCDLIWVGDNRMFRYGLVRHHLSSRGGISEMLHSCRRPSRQLPLRLRWSLYWRRGGLNPLLNQRGAKPFQCCCSTPLTFLARSPISQCSGHGRTLVKNFQNGRCSMSFSTSVNRPLCWLQNTLKYSFFTAAYTQK